jgi:hypothetical protein
MRNMTQGIIIPNISTAEWAKVLLKKYRIEYNMKGESTSIDMRIILPESIRLMRLALLRAK